MTKKEMFEMTINILAETVAPEKEDLIAGLQHEIELLDRKRSTPKGMTKTQKENEVIMTQILDALGTFETPVKQKMKIKCVELNKIYKNIKEVAKDLNLEKTCSISKCLTKNTETAYGYHWEYITGKS